METPVSLFQLNHGSLRVNNGSILPACILSTCILLVVCVVSPSIAGWTPAGETDAICIEKDGGVVLAASDGQHAGILSDSLLLPPESDAVWVDCEVEKVDAQGLTLAVVDDETGESIAYYQNPVRIDSLASFSVLLRLERTPRGVRIFAGTHGRASTARFRVTVVRPVRTGVAIHRLIYGVRIGAPEDNMAGQVFMATGTALEGIMILLRPIVPAESHDGLRVRLYAWNGSLENSRIAAPLAETLVPSRLLDGKRRSEKSVNGEGNAPFESSIHRLAISLRATTIPGKLYLLDLAAVGSNPPKSCYTSYAWVDSYDSGFMLKSGRNSSWDLYLETYDANW